MWPAFLLLAAFVLVSRASLSSPFSWALQEGNLMLKSFSVVDKVQTKSEGAMHLITADWLRERCSSDSCVDTDSQQPLHDPHQIEAVRIVDVLYTEAHSSQDFTKASSVHGWENASSHKNVLHIQFSDNTSSNFGVDYLLREIENHGPTPMQGSIIELPSIFPWDSGLSTPPVFSWHNLEYYWDNLVRQLLSVGILVVDGVPRAEGFCTDFGSRLSTVRDTEWGHEFNVRTEPDLAQDVVKKDLAYTSKAIGLHTDNPYRDPMPDIQLLHQIDGCTCPENQHPCATCATENTFSDGLAVAEKLYKEDPAAFDLLSTINVRWENNGGDGKSMMIVHKPIIEVDRNRIVDGKCLPAGTSAGVALRIVECISGIRHSAKSGGYAPLLPPEISAKFFAARRKFSAMLSAPGNIIRLFLKPGQLVIFSNRRVLHSRSTVISDKPRFLQGCYINNDGLYYRFTKSQVLNPRPKFTSLDDASKADFELIGQEYTQHVDNKMLDTFFKMLDNQKGALLGQPVDLWEHNLQTATRAYRAGEDVDTIVMSLFHDVTESIVSKNHGEAVAGLLEPYLNPKTIWMLRHHEVFQGYYYFHHFGANRLLRERYAKSEHYDDLVRWCENYDQVSFDPGYPNLDQNLFVPLVRKVFDREPFWWDPSHPKRTAVTGIQKAKMEL